VRRALSASHLVYHSWERVESGRLAMSLTVVQFSLFVKHECHSPAASATWNVCNSSLKLHAPKGRGTVRFPKKQRTSLLRTHPSAIRTRELEMPSIRKPIPPHAIPEHVEASSLHSEETSEGRQLQKWNEIALEKQRHVVHKNEFSWEMILLGFGIGIWFFVGSEQSALAFWPEGPLVEEFWENMRRYGLYFFTVGTGAVYTILKPIYELLKNPISAVLVIVIISGIFYLLYLTLTAMIGISEFSYQYAS